MRLVNVPRLKAIMPLTLEQFVVEVEQSSSAAAEILKTQWLKECCTIVETEQDSIESLMPQDNEVSIYVIACL